MLLNAVWCIQFCLPDELVAKYFDSSCIGAQVTDPEPGRGAHLNQLSVGKKKYLHIIPESHDWRFDNGLYEIAVVEGDFPVFLAGDPRFKFLPLLSICPDRLAVLHTTTGLGIDAVRQPATFRQCRHRYRLVGSAGAATQNKNRGQDPATTSVSVQCHRFEPSVK